MSTATADPADRFVTHDASYLLSHSVGLPVRGTRAAIDEYIGVWEADPADAWPRWLDTIDGFRQELAGLLGGDAASICPQSNVSSGLTKVLDALRPSFGRSVPRLLLTEAAFPSLGYVCEHSGYEVRYIGSDQRTLDPDVWAKHLTSDIDVVLVTHVHSNTGELVPAADIARIARDRGVVSIVDVAQSVGIIPIDVGGWDADVLVGSCVKWLSGGPGAGWIWVDPAMIDRCRPNDVGWFSHEDPFEFDIHRFRYAPDALRFWGGSPTVLPFVVARAAIATIAEIGVDTIRNANLALGDLLIERLDGHVVSPVAADQRSGTCIVAGDEALVDALLREGIEVDHRASGIRISPHVHTARADIERTAALIAAMPNDGGTPQ